MCSIVNLRQCSCNGLLSDCRPIRSRLWRLGCPPSERETMTSGPGCLWNAGNPSKRNATKQTERLRNKSLFRALKEYTVPQIWRVGNFRMVGSHEASLTTYCFWIEGFWNSTFHTQKKQCSLLFPRRKDLRLSLMTQNNYWSPLSSSSLLLLLFS